MSLVIRGARVIDGTGADPRRDCTLVVEDRRITAVSPGGGTRPPGGAEILDVEGRTVIPGLINCHVHLQMDAGRSPLSDLAAEPAGLTLLRAARRATDMLRRGITTVRDCGAKDWQVIHLGQAIAEGVMEGPRIFACGRAICAVGGHALVLSEPVADEAQAGLAARRQLAAGAAFIKVMATGGFGKDGERPDHSELGVAQIRAAAEAAHAAGRKVTVHAYGNQGIRDAIAAGVDSIEHAAFPDQSTLALLGERGIFIVPTLTNTFKISRFGRASGLPEYMVETAAAAFPTMMANARRAWQASVPRAIGTDAGSWLNTHTDIATELRLRVEAGATPMAVLTMATRNGARCLGIDRDVGTLEPGKLADLVVLDGDPLDDLSAVERVHAVYREGHPVRVEAED
ncbi:MAG: amidohydrolase family protein, partial [Candidatus Rokuibacteriota bacterium]